MSFDRPLLIKLLDCCPSSDGILDTLHVIAPVGTRYKFGNTFMKELATVSLAHHKMLPKTPMNGIVDFFDYSVVFNYFYNDPPFITPKGIEVNAQLTFGIAFKSDKHYAMSYFNLSVAESSVETLEDQIERMFPDLPQSEYVQLPLEFFKAFLNCFIYLNSGDPDLREYKVPPTHPRKERDRALSLYGKEDAILVSWDWKKPIEYTEERVFRRGHFCWQRHGKGNSLVKLIWRRDNSLPKRK